VAGVQAGPKKRAARQQVRRQCVPELLVATEWSAAQAFNIETSVFMNNSASGAGAHQNVIVQFIAMVH